jgi:hypothetical protein
MADDVRQELGRAMHTGDSLHKTVAVFKGGTGLQ